MYVVANVDMTLMSIVNKLLMHCRTLNWLKVVIFAHDVTAIRVTVLQVSDYMTVSYSMLTDVSLVCPTHRTAGFGLHVCCACRTVTNLLSSPVSREMLVLPYSDTEKISYQWLEATVCFVMLSNVVYIAVFVRCVWWKLSRCGARNLLQYCWKCKCRYKNAAVILLLLTVHHLLWHIWCH